MASQTQDLQLAWHAFARANGFEPRSAREVVEWAVAEGRVDLPLIDPYDVLADRMSKALREEYGTSPDGERFRKNHAVRVTKDGVQHTMWGMLEHADHSHMQKAFTQRREQVISDLVQLDTDVRVYNSLHKDREDIQLELDFTDDVEERRAA